MGRKARTASTILLALCLASPLSALAMRMTADAGSGIAMLSGGISSVRVGGYTGLEIGEAFGDHTVMASFFWTGDQEVDSNQVWTSIPPRVGMGFGVTYSYDFTPRFGLRTEFGLELASARLVEAPASCFRLSVAPYLVFATLPESFTAYEVIFPVVAAFSASRFEVRVGIGFSYHIAPRFGGVDAIPL